MALQFWECCPFKGPFWFQFTSNEEERDQKCAVIVLVHVDVGGEQGERVPSGCLPLKEPPQKAGTPVNTPGRRQISRVSLHEEVDNRRDVTNIPTVPGRQSRVRQERSRE